MHKHSILIAGAMTLGIIVGAAPVSAQEPERPQTPMPPTRTGEPKEARNPATVAMDEAFVRKAMSGGHAEVELATLAQQKASSEPVKQLAQRIESDHQKTNTELMAIAEKKNISVSHKPSGDQKKLKAKLEQLSGAEFERVYLDAMTKDHQKDIKAFEQQASSGTDPELKAFASKTLPDLKEHLKMTMDAQRALTSTSQQQ